MAIVYRTNGAWGAGIGINLTAAQVDGNFWDHEQRIVTLETDPPDPIGIASASISNLNLVFTLTDSTVLDPLPLPLPLPRWRDEWAPVTLYDGMDFFTVAGSGLYSVLRDHTSGAAFDPLDGDTAVAAESIVAGIRYIIATVGTTDFTAIGASANTVGTSFLATAAGSGTGTAKPQRYLLLVGPDSSTLLDDLANVVITNPDDDHFLVLTGDSPAQWTNRSPTAVTALLDDFIGDDASPSVGGTKGLVPAPSAGDGAAGKFLAADGSWSIVTSGINQLTGDVTAGPGTGSQVATLANSGVSAGTYAAANITVDAKGRVTAASAGALDDLSDVVITAPADGDLVQYDTGTSKFVNAAGTSLSGLTTVSALDYESYVEVSEPDDSSPALYTSKKIMLGGLSLTLGSTAISLGSTAGTIAGLTLTSPTLTTPALGTPASGTLTNCTGLPVSTGVSGLGTGVATFLATPSSANLASAITDETGSGALVFGTSPTISGATLSGTTTLPGLGQITTNGELAIGGSASGLLGVFGTYTTATSTLTQITATLASSVTSTQIGLNLSPTFSPSGASLTTVQSVGANPALSGSALNISVLQGIAVVPRILAGYTGTVASSRGLQVNDVSITGTGLVTDSNEFYAGTITHGNGLTTGSNTNRQFYALGITSSAAGGTLNNRGFELVVPSGGASSGTANNRGLYITSNGGTASGGTVNNHAIYNDSTANVYLSAGNVGIQVVTPTIALDVAGRIRAKVYTAATLPAAGTQGARAFVSDANATTFASVVAGGGANPVPVYDDGTNWRIG